MRKANSSCSNSLLRSMDAHIPANLNLQALLTEHPPAFKFNIDCFLYILSLISEIPAFTKDVLTNDGFVPLSSRVLQSNIRDYNKYLSYLTSHQILETDGHYIKDVKCTGYRFTRQYLGFNKKEQIKKKSILVTVQRRRESRFESEERYPYLKKFFNSDLRIDYDSALDWLNQNFREDTDEKNSIPKYNARVIGVDRLRNHDFHFSVDGFSGRLHTNITVLKKELRKFITYDGARLVSIDIQNSQPFLAARLLREESYTIEPHNAYYILNSSNNGSINPYVCNPGNILSISNGKSCEGLEKAIYYIMLVSRKERDSMKQYIHEVEKGTLYESMQEVVMKESGLAMGRSEMKREVLRTLYSDNRFIGQRGAEVKRIFSKIYPAPYEVFKLIKSRDKILLPNLLQTMEAKLILDCIARRISVEKPWMPIFTIHDNVVCPVGYEGYLHQVMDEEAYRATLLHPKLHLDYWGGKNQIPYSPV